ncbi:hypothetical protein FOL47_008678 [Perkinsus chesapeaki]|uniref:Protein kinase domain-containing protein n=1 Tax=Perkinsus chesapeaki TaxID=330153 RepID=A0A7J6MUB2_PERCH|nr:hypothetical protein FOL47_008678 [Perkinsus chesapeaki]
MMKSVSEGERLGPGRGVTLQDFFDAAEAVGHVMLASSSAPPSRINSAGATCPSARSNARRGSLNNRSSFLGVRPPISPEGQRRASWVGGMRNRSSSEYNRSRCCSATSYDYNQDDEDAQFPLPCRARSYNAGISTGSPALGSRTPGSLSKLHPNRRRMPGALQRLTDSVTNGNMRLIVTDDTSDDEGGNSALNCTPASAAVPPPDRSEEVPANVRDSGKLGAASRSRKSSLIDLGALLCRPRRNSRVACFVDAHPPSPQTLASADVDFGNLIGSGSFGDVFKAKCKLSGEFIAVKVVSYEDSDKVSEVAAKQLANEMDILQQLEHPNIIKYLGHEFIPPNVEWDPLPRDPAMHHRLLQHKCSMGRLLVFTEYMSGGSVKSALNDFGAFEEAQIANYSCQILSGLEYLHRKSVSHRDLKCDNLLLDAYGTVKLGALMTQLSGSIPWMAPEVISAGDSKGYSISADIWSFGIVVIEMATGTHPWGKLENPVMAIYKILSTKAVDPPSGAVNHLNEPHAPSFYANLSSLRRHDSMLVTTINTTGQRRGLKEIESPSTALMYLKDTNLIERNEGSSYNRDPVSGARLISSPVSIQRTHLDKGGRSRGLKSRALHNEAYHMVLRTGDCTGSAGNAKCTILGKGYKLHSRPFHTVDGVDIFSRNHAYRVEYAEGRRLDRRYGHIAAQFGTVRGSTPPRGHGMGSTVCYTYVRT